MSGELKILVIQGPNLNMLGVREPHIYGSGTMEELHEKIAGHASALKIRIDFFQSNHEGAIIDTIQNAMGRYDGMIINPGAYTHTSIAIPDAIKTVNIPTVEVHISDIHKREAYRQISYIKEVAIEQISGLGWDGYIRAVDKLAEYHKNAK